MTDRELDGQIVWFEDLREALEQGKIEDAKKATDAALKLLWKEKESRAKRLEKV
jgi:hypothetical protein